MNQISRVGALGLVLAVMTLSGCIYDRGWGERRGGGRDCSRERDGGSERCVDSRHDDRDARSSREH